MGDVSWLLPTRKQGCSTSQSPCRRDPRKWGGGARSIWPRPSWAVTLRWSSQIRAVRDLLPPERCPGGGARSIFIRTDDDSQCTHCTPIFWALQFRTIIMFQKQWIIREEYNFIGMYILNWLILYQFSSPFRCAQDPHSTARRHNGLRLDLLLGMYFNRTSIPVLICDPPRLFCENSALLKQRNSPVSTNYATVFTMSNHYNQYSFSKVEKISLPSGKAIPLASYLFSESQPLFL